MESYGYRDEDFDCDEGVDEMQIFLERHFFEPKNSKLQEPISIKNLQNLEEYSDDENESPIHERLIQSQELRMKRS